MGILIDTSVLIEHQHGRLALDAHLADHKHEEFFLSVITASELLHGVHRTVDAGLGARRSAWVEAILERFPILPIDLSTSRIHARIWATLAQEGRVIGRHDLWLAASALAQGLTIVTGNLREFQRVSGLAVELWS